MKLSDFDFDLPEALIATRPVTPRSDARLLLSQGDETRDLYVRDLPDQLRAGDRMVLNDTKVIRHYTTCNAMDDQVGGRGVQLYF